MKTPTPAAQWVARLLAILLWIVGSAYLVRAELGQPSPDLVVIAATPIVWLAVIALPILAEHALRHRQWLAAALLALSAVAGSAYTLSGTLARQAEARDVKVAKADEADKARRGLDGKLAEAEAMLAEARRKHAAECASGKGKRCDGIAATVLVYEGAVEGYRAKIARLDVASPVAGERRIAAALAWLPWSTRSADELAPAVGLFAPALLGLFIELAALAAAMYGWHVRRTTLADRMQTSFAGVAPATMFAGEIPDGPPRPPRPGHRRPLSANVPANVLPFSGKRRASDREHLRAALTNVGAPVNNGTLASLMGVTDGEASRRWRAAADMLEVERRGREVLISLKRAAG